MNINYLRDLSPLRYPGSKQKITKYLEKILAYNSINPDVLIEPFVGGGSVFLYCIVSGIVNEVIISDKDELVYSFWKVIFSEPEILIEFVSSTKIDIDTFNYYKYISANTKEFNEHDLAKACLYLNRTSFSGILSSSTGPIGGKYQKSKYKIDCRFNRKSLANKIEYISKFKNKVTVLSYNWKEALSTSFESNKGKAIFVYLDPPFFNKAKDLYRIYFNYDDHLELCNYLCKLEHTWILSYDNTEEIISMYKEKNYGHIHIEIPYSINSQATRIEKELIITHLSLPELV